jgi:hypothetical protein
MEAAMEPANPKGATEATPPTKNALWLRAMRVANRAAGVAPQKRKATPEDLEKKRVKYQAKLAANKEGERAKQAAAREAKKAGRTPLAALAATEEHRVYMAQRKADGKGPTAEQMSEGNKRKWAAITADPERHEAAREKNREWRENQGEETKEAYLAAARDRAAYNRAALSEEERAAANADKAEWMRQDRLANPGKYADKDNAKYAATMADPAKAEHERQRQREKGRRKRDAIMADPEAYAADREADKKRKLQHAETVAPEERETELARRREGYHETVAAVKDGSGTSRCYTMCATCHQNLAWEFDDCWPCRTGLKNAKKFEAEVISLLESEEMYFSSYDRAGPCSSESARRADFVFHAKEMAYIIILEVDEDYHRGYTPECETVRLQQLKDQYPFKPVFFVRYHPLRCRVKRGAVIERGSIKDASKKELIMCVKTIMELPPPEEDELPCGYNMVFLGYPDDRVQELASTRERMQHDAMRAAVDKHTAAVAQDAQRATWRAEKVTQKAKLATTDTQHEQKKDMRPVWRAEKAAQRAKRASSAGPKPVPTDAQHEQKKDMRPVWRAEKAAQRAKRAKDKTRRATGASSSSSAGDI